MCIVIDTTAIVIINNNFFMSEREDRRDSASVEPDIELEQAEEGDGSFISSAKTIPTSAAGAPSSFLNPKRDDENNNNNLHNSANRGRKKKESENDSVEEDDDNGNNYFSSARAHNSSAASSSSTEAAFSEENVKNRFKEFIRNFTTQSRSSVFPYRNQLLQNANNSVMYLEISLEDLLAFDPIFANELQNHPSKYIPFVS